MPGTISKPMPALAQAAASSGPVAYVNGSPAMRRTTLAPVLACLTTSVPRAAWVSVSPSSPTPPSTISAPLVTSAACSGSSVMTTSAWASSSAARTVSRLASPGPAPTKLTWPRRALRALGLGVDGASGIAVVMVTVFLFSVCQGVMRRRPRGLSAPSASISTARRSPTAAASEGKPVADSRMVGAPEMSPTTARSHSSSPSSPSATSARAPTGALQPASRVARRLRSAVTAARVSRSSSPLEQANGRVIVGAALDRPALPARGQEASGEDR